MSAFNSLYEERKREEEKKMAKRGDAEETEYKGEAKEQQETVSEQEVACDASHQIEGRKRRRKALNSLSER